MNVFEGPLDAIDWCNLHSPSSASINGWEGVTIYSQGLEPGVTDVTGQGGGIDVWIGYSTANTHPSTWAWTDWVEAAYQTDAGNNDEYAVQIGSDQEFAPGTYYYATRWQLNNGQYIYGGFSSTGGGFWDGTNNVSGVLTVNPVTNDICSDAVIVSCNNGAYGTTVGATLDTEVECPAPLTAPGIWYKYIGTGEMVSADVCGASFDTKIYIYTGTCGSLTCMDGNDDYCNLQSRVDWFAEAGEEYYILVHGFSSSTGIFYLNIDCTSPTTAIWVGSDGSNENPNPLEDWFGADNWDVQDVPGIATDVIIPTGLADYPTIDRLAVCNNILVGSDVSGTATILDRGYLTVNGTAIAERYFSGNDADWHLVSPPISDAQAGVFMDMYLMSFDETPAMPYGPDNDYGYTDIIEPMDGLTKMEGYALYSTLGANNTVSFTGNLNFSPQSHPFNLNGNNPYGWNLLGNPFVSSIDWETVTIPSGLSNEVHYIDAATGNDISYVQSVGGTGSQYIPPHQGFFVSASATGSLVLSDAQRTHEGSDSFYKNDNPNLLILVATNANFSDKTLIHFNEGAGVGHDGTFDAYKRISTSNPELPQIYSYTPSGDKLSVNGLPQTNMVPVGFVSLLPGEFEISTIETGDFSIVILEDLVTGIKTNMLADSYNFIYNLDDQENRFIVHFTPLAVEDNRESIFNIYSFSKDVYVSVPTDTKGEITIYSITGQEIANSAITGTISKISLKSTGFYIVKVQNGQELITRKVFVK